MRRAPARPSTGRAPGTPRGRPRAGPRGRLTGALLLLPVLLAPSALLGQEGAFVIRDVEVEGVRTVPAERVIALSGLRAGDPVTLVDLREAVRRLWGAELFRDAAADVRVVPGSDPSAAIVPVTVVLSVDEAPIASEVRIEGADEIDEDDLAEALPTKPGDRILPHELAAGEAAVEALYEKKGWYLARAEARAGSPDADFRAPVELRIEEGRRVAVDRIEFEGNRSLEDGVLRDAMETETDGWLPWQDGEYLEDVLRVDLTERLPRAAADRGYLDFTVVSDTFEVNPETGKGVLRIEVAEGPQYVLEDVTIEGNTRFSSEDLGRLVVSQPGQIYSEEDVE